MSELKPCPFCGSKGIQPENIKTRSGRPCWQIGCSNFCFFFTRSTKKQCILDWNKRQPHPAIQAVYDDCRVLFVISEAVRSPNRPESRVVFKLWNAIREAVEEC